MSANNWPDPTDIEGHLRQTEKRISHQERANDPLLVKERLGPGINRRGVELVDLNAEVATFNGYYYANPGTIGSPDETRRWIIHVVSQDDNNGVQMAWEAAPEEDPLAPPPPPPPAEGEVVEDPNAMNYEGIEQYVRYFSNNTEDQYKFTTWYAVGGNPLMNIYGATITGSTLRTARPPEPRIEIRSAINDRNTIFFFTVDPAEITPAQIRSTVVGAEGRFSIRGHDFGSTEGFITITAGDHPSEVTILYSATGGHTFNGHVQTSSGLQVLQGIDVNGGATIGGATNVADLGATGDIASLQGIYAGGRVSANAGLFDNGLSGGGTDPAEINDSGRVVRGVSSERYKYDIQPMDLATAMKSMDLIPVTYRLNEESEKENPVVYPGFIAEQAAEVGMDLWVRRNEEGEPDGFRYHQLTAAHNLVIQDLKATVEQQAEQIQTLTDLVNQLISGPAQP